MSAGSATTTIKGYSIRVELHAKAASGLDDDAFAAAHAAAAWLAINTPARPIADMREEYRAASEGETDTDCTDTDYGLLISELESVAGVAATNGWHNPDGCDVTVDVDAA